MRTRHEGEGGEKTSWDVKRLEKEIPVLREQLTRAAKTMVLREQKLIKLDNDNRALRRSEHQVAPKPCPRTKGTRGDQRRSQVTKVVDAGVGWSVVEERMSVADGTRLEGEGS